MPEQTFIWQDPVPAVDHELVNARDIKKLKSEILDSGLTTSELVGAAWASASSFRGTDMRGGANGARVRLTSQKDWAANNPAVLAKVVGKLEAIQADFNKGRRKVSLADLIVLGGAAAIEDAAKKAGQDIEVPFTPGRTDATQEMTDAASFDVLRPEADGFRNYFEIGSSSSPADSLVEKAALLELTVPEMTVHVGGVRALDANSGGSDHGVFTARPGTLSNDFYVNLVDMSKEWKKSASNDGVYEGYVRGTDQVKWTATAVDLVFGSNSELRAVAEYYAFDNAQEAFVQDFVDALVKVMNLGRY